MTDAADLGSVLRMPPSEAAEFFRQKLNVPTRHWDDLWHETHSRGFMVAGATSEALLSDFRTAVDQAIAGKLTTRDFRKEFDAIVARHGWAHNGGAEWRSNLIYGVNTSMAYSAGRYARQTTPEALEMFPYWQMQHHTCQHPRPEHVAWSGLVLRADDPWWNTHYPPNGWRCHCTVNVLSERMMRRRGLSLSEAPALNARPWRNPRTGEVIWVPEGIDPGFAYNPGKAWQQGLTPPIGKTPRFRADDAGPATPPPATPDHAAQTVLEPVPDDHRDAARQSAILRLHKTPVGNVEAGVVPDTVRHALGAQTDSVRLSGETMEKQLHKHADLTENDYRQIPRLLAHPDVVVHQGERRVLILHHAGRLYRAAVKTTGDGSENYLLSFHRTTKEKTLRSLGELPPVIGDIKALPDDETDEQD